MDANLTGTDSALNVFQVAGSALYSANSVVINVPAGSEVLINVSGTTDQLANVGINAPQGSPALDPTHILWNFNQATSLFLNSVGVPGSVRLRPGDG